MLETLICNVTLNLYNTLSLYLVDEGRFSKASSRKPSLKQSLQSTDRDENHRKVGYGWSFLGTWQKLRVISVSFNLKVWAVSGLTTNCCYFLKKCLHQSHQQMLSPGSFYVGIHLAPTLLWCPCWMYLKVMKNRGMHSHLECIHSNSTDSFPVEDT